MKSWWPSALSDRQERYEREPRSDAVPAERLQAITPDEADQPAHHEQRHDERHDEADRDLVEIAGRQRGAVFVELEHGGAEHRRHREIEREGGCRLALDAEQLAAENGGARTRHAGDDREHLAEADLQRFR